MTTPSGAASGLAPDHSPGAPRDRQVSAAQSGAAASSRALPAEAYQAIREDAAIDTDLPLATFPEACPWTVEQVLDADFWLEASSMS